ncbi:oligosaccharide flippase family protein [Tardiphaga sp. 215_C5_N2_1]|uniref:oligosaccharide flippase family protein n=1 Tax=Tardiphaga sp. 215_C5_N2_1 TaxID=3240774 RepID=UPI003F88EF08
MIIETFGPPGAGKTTFSQALAQRLRDRGYEVDLVLTLPHLSNHLLNFGGFLPALQRVTLAIFATIAILCRPIANARGLRLAKDLLRLMPPNNPVWWIRLSQYVVRFSCVWRDSHKSDRIVLFDQGFVQIVCTLALFSRADEKTIARAIGMRTQSDLLIRFDAPKELLEKRLHERVHQKTYMEKWFEPDVATFLKAKPITDYVGSLLAAEHQRLICINSLDPGLMSRALDRIEEEVSSKFRPNGAVSSSPDPGEESFEPYAEKFTPPLPTPETIGAFTAPAQPELARRMASASLWAFVIYVGGAGLTCVAQLVIARTIGATSYGIYSYVLAWTTLLSYIAGLGFNTALLRYVPAYSATGKWPLARGVIQFAFGRSLLVGMLIAICGVATALFLSETLHRELTISLAVGMATVPLVALYVLGSATVRALGGVISAIAPERFVRDGLMVVLLLLAVALNVTPIDATTVLIALMASSAVTAAIVGLSMRKLWPPQLRSAVPAYAPRDWWHLACPVMILIGVEVLMSRAGVIILGWTGDAHEAGIFALGLNLALFLVLPRMAVGTFFSPNVSKLHAHRNEAALQSLFARATVLSLAGTVVLALPLLLLTVPLLRFFGEEFVATAPVAQILVVGQIFAAATGPQQNLLTMTGHERAAAAITAIGAIMNVVACAIGIAFFGVMGAAVATAVTNVAWNMAMAIYIYKRVNMTAGLLFAFVEFRRPAAAE